MVGRAIGWTFALAALAVPFAARAAEALPLFGGDVRALAVDPRDPDRVFAGTAAGQVYRSDDAGASWREAGEPVAFPSWVVAALAFDPHREGRLWAGLRGVWGGGGVAFSDDLGASWRWRAGGGLAAEAVHALLPGAGAPDRLLVGTRGGLWRSDDAGASWRKLSAGVAGLDQVTSLAVDPDDPERLLAGTWRRAYRSADGGATWSGVFDGMALDTEVFRLVPAADGGRRLWAATCGWIYRTDGFGASWTRVTEGLLERRTRALAALSPSRLVVGTIAGVFLSDDGGESFRRAGEPGLSVVALAHHPRRPERLFAAADGAGIWRSLDGGETFSAASSGLAALRVPALVESEGTLYAAVPWAGPASGVYRSRADGGGFERLGGELVSPLGLAVAEGRLFASTGGALLAWDADGWRRVAEGRVAGLRSDGRSFTVRVDGRSLRWHGGRLEPVASPPAESSAAPLPAVASLPPGSVLAAAHWRGRWVVATAGYGLRALPGPVAADDSVAFEAREDPQIGREALRRDR